MAHFWKLRSVYSVPLNSYCSVAKLCATLLTPWTVAHQAPLSMEFPRQEYQKVLVTQSCPTLCDPRDCSPPGSSVHRISQIRILEWVAISSCRGSSQSRDQTFISCIGKWILNHYATWENYTPILINFFLKEQYLEQMVTNSSSGLSQTSFSSIYA